jgi:16S rRNA (guanine966-N2)-methyltransferase
MIRIVGGKHKGRKLFEPTHEPIRPALDRARESLFNVLAHSFEKPLLYNARVLDAFAGTGAYGLEALSRGASFCAFIDLDPGSLQLVQKNIALLQEEDKTKVFLDNSTKVQRCSLDPFDLVILAPPYGKNLVNPALDSLIQQGWIHENAMIIVEVDTKENYDLYQKLPVILEKKYGRNHYYFYKKHG